MKLELVTWRDARGCGQEWMDRERFVEGKRGTDGLLIETVGWCVLEDGEALWLAGSWASNDDISDVTEIPVGMVKERVVLRDEHWSE